MQAVQTVEASASVVLDAADRLIGDLADAVSPFRAVGDALAALADGLGVEKVIVAVDDARLGRQVFCSGRVPLGVEGVGLRGPQGAWTQPPRALDDVAASILVRTVAAGVVRSTARAPNRALEAANAGSALATRSTALADAMATATARAVRHGWGFTLVLVRGGARLAEVLAAGVRAADQVIVRDDHDVALLLPQTGGDRVPRVLARLTAGRDTPPFDYGLACCPADGTDPAALSLIAAERLAVATRAGTGS